MNETIYNFLKELWGTVVQMSPYLLLGFFVAGLLSIFLSSKVVERHLGGRGLLPLLKASLFGVPLPLCSCGVIPVSISLRKHGASKGATIAFLLSTPQTGVDSILVTLSLLGPVFAIYRPFVALMTGLVGGTIVELADKEKIAEHSSECTDECCSEQGRKKSKIVRLFRYGFVTLPRDIAAAMLAGLVVAAVISAAVPDDFFAPLLGSSIVAMLVMMVLGIPVYVCATASVPIAAALMAKGISPGAALVFLMTGPATNAATFTTIWSVLGKKVALIYIGTVAGCALGFGFLLDLLVKGGGSEMVHQHGSEPGLLGITGAVVLLVVLIFGVINKYLLKEQ